MSELNEESQQLDASQKLKPLPKWFDMTFVFATTLLGWLGINIARFFSVVAGREELFNVLGYAAKLVPVVWLVLGIWQVKTRTPTVKASKAAMSTPINSRIISSLAPLGVGTFLIFAGFGWVVKHPCNMSMYTLGAWTIVFGLAIAVLGPSILRYRNLRDQGNSENEAFTHSVLMTIGLFVPFGLLSFLLVFAMSMQDDCHL